MMTGNGYGLFGELTLEGYVMEYFGMAVRNHINQYGENITVVTPDKGSCITNGVFEAMAKEYRFVAVRVTEFGTIEATFIKRGQ